MFFVVTWKVENTIIRIGETVALTCYVHEVTVIDPEETRQWFKESRIILYNGHPTKPLKYRESLNGNQFKLLIYNVTEGDLNRKYQCLYSYDVFSKILSITEESFECKYITSINIKTCYIQITRTYLRFPMIKLKSKQYSCI